MSGARRSRFLAPVVVILGGSGVAGAVAIGHSWGDALATEVVALLLGFGSYLLTKSDSDVGAIYGHQADERQREILYRASRLSLFVMIGTAFVCVLITVALNASYWQADLIGSLGGVSYLGGMLIYGVRGPVEANSHGESKAASVTPKDG